MKTFYVLNTAPIDNCHDELKFMRNYLGKFVDRLVVSDEYNQIATIELEEAEIDVFYKKLCDWGNADMSEKHPYDKDFNDETDSYWYEFQNRKIKDS
jgi:hypothetical protein